MSTGASKQGRNQPVNKPNPDGLDPQYLVVEKRSIYSRMARPEPNSCRQELLPPPTEQHPLLITSLGYNVKFPDSSMLVRSAFLVELLHGALEIGLVAVSEYERPTAVANGNASRLANVFFGLFPTTSLHLALLSGLGATTIIVAGAWPQLRTSLGFKPVAGASTTTQIADGTPTASPNRFAPSILEPKDQPASNPFAPRPKESK